jgi:hypothetical protein
MDKMKSQIFAQAREKIRLSAQYTKNGRKPWTQFSVKIPILHSNTTDDEDLAVVYHLMHECTRDMVTVNDEGDYTWSLFGPTDFLTWLNIDPSTTCPIDKYVHPVNYETGIMTRRRLERKLAKAKSPLDAEDIKEKLAQLSAKEDENDKGYHWASYDECHVTFEQDQRWKKTKKKLQLTIKIRTYRVGCGDPARHGGYLRWSTENNLSDMDPTTRYYADLERYGNGRYL